MIEIHLCRDNALSTFLVSSTGALCLTIGLGQNIEEELSRHKEEIFDAIVLLYLQLFGDRDFKRLFFTTNDVIRIVPNYFENFPSHSPKIH